MLHTVKKVKYLEGYKLALVFNDGKTKMVDFEHRLKSAKNMFLDLRDIDYFKKVRADGTTIVWPNGLDICPDVLFEIGEDMPNKTHSRVKKKAKAAVTSRKTSVRSLHNRL